MNRISKQPSVSVIVPVYKVEKYLSRCIESILSQTFLDFEVLLVDDGSPDRSGAICDEYAEKDARIRVFHTKNNGVSSARNFALDQAKGEWIIFVDADDWIEHKTLEICIDTVQKYRLDLLQFSFARISSQGRVIDSRIIDSPVMDYPSYVRNGKFNVCVGGGFIRHAIIQKKKIRFQRGVKYAEDQLFICEVMASCRSIRAIPDTLYNYFFNEESATNSHKDTSDLLVSIRALIEWKQKEPIFTAHVDRMIMNMLIQIIKNKDYPPRNVMNLFHSADIHFGNLKDSHSKVFVGLDKISSWLAYKVLCAKISLTK